MSHKWLIMLTILFFGLGVNIVSGLTHDEQKLADKYNAGEFGFFKLVEEVKKMVRRKLPNWGYTDE